MERLSRSCKWVPVVIDDGWHPLFSVQIVEGYLRHPSEIQYLFSSYAYQAAAEDHYDNSRPKQIAKLYASLTKGHRVGRCAYNKWHSE